MSAIHLFASFGVFFLPNNIKVAIKRTGQIQIGHLLNKSLPRIILIDFLLTVPNILQMVSTIEPSSTTAPRKRTSVSRISFAAMIF